MSPLWFIAAAAFLLCAHPCYGAEGEVKGISTNQVRKDVLETIFSGEELHYSISWSGGVKIGDLHLLVKREEGRGSAVIHARVTDYGVFKWFYPVDDTFTTVVQEPMMLPLRYDVLQKEGWSGKETRRRYQYNQDKPEVRYRKNEQAEEVFHPTGTVYNEFAAFFINRALDFEVEGDLIIPTFADKKRHEVKVEVVGREPKESSLLGTVDTIKVMPKMEFKGLYDKDGDTIFWLTDDSCRIPVEVRSKIVIGSLTAELVNYRNGACKEFTGGRKTSPGLVEVEGE